MSKNQTNITKIYGVAQLPTLTWLAVFWTSKGLEHATFAATQAKALKQLASLYNFDEAKKDDLQVKAWLNDYEANKGDKLRFNLKGTDFQKSVWKNLLKIKFGQTVCYLDIANAINNPKAVRAVGQAIGKNPVGLFVPCHRVIQKNGKLGGFAGGVSVKQKLLQFESQ